MSTDLSSLPVALSAVALGFTLLVLMGILLGRWLKRQSKAYSMEDKGLFSHPWVGSWYGQILNREGVPIEEINECLKWAIGDDWKFISTSHWDNRWRNLHPELTPIYGNTRLVKGLKIIAKEYLEMKNYFETLDYREDII